MNNNQLKKIIVMLLLPALCWLFFNSVYYRHLHKASSGVTTSHAHPYDKTNNCSNSPFSSHNHTEEEFVLFDIISNTILLVLVTIFASLVLFDQLIKDFNFLIKDKLYKLDLYLLQKYRGPPCNS